MGVVIQQWVWFIGWALTEKMLPDEDASLNVKIGSLLKSMEAIVQEKLLKHGELCGCGYK